MSDRRTPVEKVEFSAYMRARELTPDLDKLVVADVQNAILSAWTEGRASWVIRCKCCWRAQKFAEGPIRR